MKLTVGGGCGEHGRNCFLVESEHVDFIVDCGIMPGVEDPYPRLSDAQIKTAKWLFITHSHIDHTGAYTWLCERGFSGCVIMTRETAGQLAFSPKRLYLIDDMAPAMSSLPLKDKLSVTWGKSGQCAGSVWYDFCVEDKRILFSGDYVEDTLVYRCDPIRNFFDDIAVLDSAYGDAEQTPADYRDALVELVKSFLRQKRTILFPVPRYGRGLELLLLLHKYFPNVPYMLDAHLEGEISRLQKIEDWIKPEAMIELQRIPYINNDAAQRDNGFVFLSDPQLKSAEGQKFAGKITDMDGKIIITGNADMGSHSEKLLMCDRALPSRYAVHMSNADRIALEKQNHFANVVPYHNESQ